MGNEPRYKNEMEFKITKHNCKGQVNEFMKYLITSL